MKEKLEKLLDNAYAPYSNFKVACIIITNDNQEFVGVNVENASYGATICAERSAITNAITNGCKKGDFKRLSIMNSSMKVATPCFICRQLFVEFFNPDMPVICYSIDGKCETYQVKDLCPYEFGEDNL